MLKFDDVEHIINLNCVNHSKMARFNYILLATIFQVIREELCVKGGFYCAKNKNI